VPFGAVMLGVTEVMDPNLSAQAYISDTETALLFECEDAGSNCASDARRSLQGTSVVEAAVRTIRGDDLDADILKQPGAYLAQGVQEVSFFATEAQDDTLSREEYVIVFYGGIE
jgi:hypothetical protein